MNIVHRDLKAGNVLITASGEVRLADFGVSAQLSPIKPACVTLIGTPYWMVLFFDSCCCCFVLFCFVWFCFVFVCFFVWKQKIYNNIIK
jgi:hypothetical protein